MTTHRLRRGVVCGTGANVILHMRHVDGVQVSQSSLRLLCPDADWHGLFHLHSPGCG
ncbi:hypothetical protein GW721_23525 [Citrobacter braakii]|nr:hypothetical protein [Citrobacter braakii]